MGRGRRTEENTGWRGGPGSPRVRVRLSVAAGRAAHPVGGALPPGLRGLPLLPHENLEARARDGNLEVRAEGLLRPGGHGDGHGESESAAGPPGGVEGPLLCAGMGFWRRRSRQRAAASTTA